MACSMYLPACSEKRTYSGHSSEPAERLCYSSCINVYTDSTSGGCYTSMEFAQEYCNKLVASGLAIAPINDTQCSDLMETCWKRAVDTGVIPNGGTDYSEADAMYNASVVRTQPKPGEGAGRTGLLKDGSSEHGELSDTLPADGSARTLSEALTQGVAALTGLLQRALST